MVKNASGTTGYHQGHVEKTKDWLDFRSSLGICLRIPMALAERVDIGISDHLGDTALK